MSTTVFIKSLVWKSPLVVYYNLSILNLQYDYTAISCNLQLYTYILRSYGFVWLNWEELYMCYQKGDEFNKTDVEKVQTTK